MSNHGYFGLGLKSLMTHHIRNVSFKVEVTARSGKKIHTGWRKTSTLVLVLDFFCLRPQLNHLSYNCWPALLLALLL